MSTYEITPIARIKNEYKDKFGIPRQSNLLKNNISQIVFEEDFRDENALRGLEEYSHLWLLWIFSETNSDKKWSPTVRPPRLGGNKRMGVFATRSPYHPNKIGLSCVKIASIEKTAGNGTVINVLGADLLDGTPIIDIKPYLAFSDSVSDAVCGFADNVFEYELSVEIPQEISENIDKNVLDEIICLLKQDPRPSYHDDENRVYGLRYSVFEIKFKVSDNIAKVISIENTNGSEE